MGPAVMGKGLIPPGALRRLVEAQKVKPETAEMVSRSVPVEDRDVVLRATPTSDPEVEVLSLDPKGTPEGPLKGDMGVNVPPPAERTAAPPQAAAGPPVERAGAGRNLGPAIQAASEERAESAVGAAGVESQGLRDRAAAVGEAVGEYQRLRADSAAEIEEATRARAEVRGRLDKILDYERYNLPEDRVDYHKSVISAALTRPQDKAASQAALKRASEVDPDRWFNRDSKRRVLSAIAMFLGGFGSAMTGTPNVAAQIIMKSIDDDIKSQEDAFSRRGKAYGAERLRLGKMMSRFDGNMSDAKSALRWAMTEQVARRIEQVAAESGSDEVRARGQQEAATLRQEGLLERAKVEDSYTGRKIQAIATNNAATRAATGGAGGPVIELSGWVGTPTDMKALQEARKFADSEAEIQQLASDLIGLRGDVATYGGGFTESGTVANAKLARLVVVMKELDNMGASFTVSEKGLLEAQTATRGGEIGWVTERLRALKEGTAQRAGPFMTNRGFRPKGDAKPTGFVPTQQ